MLDPECATCIMRWFVLGPHHLMTYWSDWTQPSMSCFGGLVTCCPMAKHSQDIRLELLFKSYTILHYRWHTIKKLRALCCDSSTGACHKLQMVSLPTMTSLKP